MAARREITKKYAHHYQRATKSEKTDLLDSLVEVTGWTRDHARRAIRQAGTRQGRSRTRPRRPRPRKYSYDALVVLQHVWEVTGQASGKYLAAVMDDTLDRLTRFGEFGRVSRRARDDVLDELRSMSPATIDRYLKPHKDALYPAAGLSGTRPSHILRSQVALRTSMDAPLTDVRYWELDTVAHCAHTLAGEFLWTLSATSPVCGWTLLRTIKNKAFSHVVPGLDWARKHAPVPIVGMDFDNGSELINGAVLEWADRRKITVTRTRPYRHNDNAHIEQRNGDWVRKHAFRYRYETDAEMRLLNRLWTLVMDRKNHLLPCVKATGWTETTAGRRKRVYDPPRTPYQRLMDTDVLSSTQRADLEQAHERLNPAKINRDSIRIQTQLIDLAAARTRGTRPAT